MTEKELIKLHEDTREMLDLLKGENLHKGNGVIERICKLERFQANYLRVVGVATGVGVVFGALFSFIKDKLL